MAAEAEAAREARAKVVKAEGERKATRSGNKIKICIKRQVFSLLRAKDVFFLKNILNSLTVFVAHFVLAVSSELTKTEKKEEKTVKCCPCIFKTIISFSPHHLYFRHLKEAAAVLESSGAALQLRYLQVCIQ